MFLELKMNETVVEISSVYIRQTKTEGRNLFCEHEKDWTRSRKFSFSTQRRLE
jgi:hypothetical protein